VEEFDPAIGGGIWVAAGAVAFDTYYAYFGTWDFNADTSVITHHINSSLLPYETGLEHRREATFDGVHLKMIARDRRQLELPVNDN